MTINVINFIINLYVELYKCIIFFNFKQEKSFKKGVNTIRAQNQKDYKFLEKKLNKKEKENVECLALVILIQLDQKWSMLL